MVLNSGLTALPVYKAIYILLTRQPLTLCRLVSLHKPVTNVESKIRVRPPAQGEG